MFGKSWGRRTYSIRTVTAQFNRQHLLPLSSPVSVFTIWLMAQVGRPLQYPERFLVQLTSEQRRTLRWLAETTGKSQSEWVRWFIDQGTEVFGLMREMEEVKDEVKEGIQWPIPNGCEESQTR